MCADGQLSTGEAVFFSATAPMQTADGGASPRTYRRKRQATVCLSYSEWFLAARKPPGRRRHAADTRAKRWQGRRAMTTQVTVTLLDDVYRQAEHLSHITGQEREAR